LNFFHFEKKLEMPKKMETVLQKMETVLQKMGTVLFSFPLPWWERIEERGA
jgi:hypothetical protein